MLASECTPQFSWRETAVITELFFWCLTTSDTWSPSRKRNTNGISSGTVAAGAMVVNLRNSGFRQNRTTTFHIIDPLQLFLNVITSIFSTAGYDVNLNVERKLLGITDICLPVSVRGFLSVPFSPSPYYPVHQWFMAREDNSPSGESRRKSRREG